jgi:hypothetical protein
MRSYPYKIFLVAVIAILVAVHAPAGMSKPNDAQIPIPIDSVMVLFGTGIAGLSLVRRK